jgi:UDP-GlcNAc:undecaprenyl-phosphate/decaprenyl-phosphate GlcNAc-1-phosphate transferase
MAIFAMPMPSTIAGGACGATRGLNEAHRLMNSLLPISLASFVASLLLTVLVRGMARRWAIVDRPDGRRKLHGRPVPLWGGVAVYGAALLGLLAVHLGGIATRQFTELSTAWLMAAGIVCFVGAVDDRFDLPSRIKLVLQIVAVLPIVVCGYSIDRIVAFGVPIHLGWLGVPMTVLWLVGCINALNLIDGMDGLASTVGLSTAAMLGVIAASQGQDHVATMAVVLAGALAGFLVYNLPPASVFLGDSGSMVIGLSVGLLGMQGTLKTSATLAITAPVVVMTLPLFDIVAAVVRRRLTGRAFDAPDRLHIHHRLLDRGWTPWQVLCLLGALCLTMGGAATAATIFRRDALAWIAAMTLVVLMIRLRLFGHHEFALAKKAVVRGVKMSVAGVVRRVGAQGSGFRVQRSNEQITTAVNAMISVKTATSGPEPRTLNPELSGQSWDTFIRRLRAWKIELVEFRALDGTQPRRIRWMAPHRTAERRCRWSIGVSLPGRGRELCELRIARDNPITAVRDVGALTALLKEFGGQFAAQPELLFGPLQPKEQAAPATERRAA